MFGLVVIDVMNPSGHFSNINAIIVSQIFVIFSFIYSTIISRQCKQTTRTTYSHFPGTNTQKLELASRPSALAAAAKKSNKSHITRGA